jgi:hypothetical protein
MNKVKLLYRTDHSLNGKLKGGKVYKVLFEDLNSTTVLGHDGDQHIVPNVLLCNPTIVELTQSVTTLEDGTNSFKEGEVFYMTNYSYVDQEYKLFESVTLTKSLWVDKSMFKVITPGSVVVL